MDEREQIPVGLEDLAREEAERKERDAVARTERATQDRTKRKMAKRATRASERAVRRDAGTRD